MLIVSNEFFEACKDKEREAFARIIVNDKVIYLKDKIKKIDYSMGALGGESFQIGSTQSATVKIVFSEIIEGLKELDEIKVEVGFKIRGTGLPSNINHVSKVDRAKVGRARLVSYVPDRYEFVPLGTFYISGRVDPDRNEKTTTLEARDGFIFMEDKYKSDLKYPTKLADIALEIANKSGSIIDPVSFNHLSNYTINKFEGYTYRQAIGLVGQFEGGFVCFDREGRLSIRKLEDPNFKIEPNEYFLKGLVKSELLYQPRGITCKVVNQTDESSNETVILQSGSTNGAQISLENNAMTQILLDDVFQKIRYINFYPISLKWRGNPALEVGDWVTMTDREGNKFKSPVLNYAMSFDGGFSSTISADTKAYSANVSSFKGPLQQKLDDIDYRIDAAGKNNVYEGTEEPANPKEGDIWFKKNGPDDEIWVYKQTAPGVFEWVMTTSTALEESIKEQIENSTPKDEIVKTINLSNEMDGKEWLKIKGAKLWLTNETKIDKAIITSAMIGSVDAGTISVGTLDASKIRVVNLDASAISTGTLDASKIRVTNLDASAITAGTLKAITIQGVNITGSKIVTDGAEFRMTQDNGKLTWFSKEHNKDFMSLEASKFTGADVGIVKYKMGDGGGFQLRDSKDNLVISSWDNGVANSTWLSFASSSLYWTSAAFGGNTRISADSNQISLNAPTSYTFRDGNLTNGMNWALYNSQQSYFNSGLRVRNGLSVAGGLSVSGTKSSLVRTENYGERLLYAYETPEYLFATYGKTITNEDGYAEVDIEPMFLETINTDSANYHVFVSPYGNTTAYVFNLNRDRFSIKTGMPNIEISWQLVAYRKDYEDFYLETPSNNDEKAPELVQYPLNISEMREAKTRKLISYERVSK
ncbi:hypothetical protein P7D73_20690 [Enterococcus raffinosus]|uniref:hypothetical protein n=1 Tax=Enterococcus raffinosus TaxID=71452 RepID=UPI002891B6B8|nr:hypothetical protein [Enterococcus raffinosus]MDT2525659.1 hypothetical protein [Enterococcus raffinosus]MDT2531837.1 hypothetical protein [Enterococcus raffinosus]MDT2536194.1 hypothetical protein [Enterococcus raffinosus]MDT2556937.1 hypothetical protein [Enterococcus raffinosus]MDT2592965.1 hypothetical protein [Enterococcus raffinosus]